MDYGRDDDRQAEDHRADQDRQRRVLVVLDLLADGERRHADDDPERQGEDDETDPIGQSQQFYRGLKRYGVDSEFVLYPREPHGLREEKHLLDRLNRIVAWYDKYLKPRSPSTAQQ